MNVSDILGYITDIAPLKWQESYDNSGLLVGSYDAAVEKILVTLDVTEAVVDEAIAKSCNLIISHHPLIFKGLKHVLSNNATERIVIKAIKNDISIAAMHTNLDNSYLGVSRCLCERLGLHDLHILRPLPEFVNDDEPKAGGGMVGMLEKPLSELDFLKLIKEKLNAKALRHTAFTNRHIQKVALCGGSGFFMLQDAINCNADAYVTADIKYHDFFEADGKLLLVDAGHFETEQFTKQLIADTILKKNPNFALLISEIKTNSINYFV